jgi:signal transduction histidine kinase
MMERRVFHLALCAVAALLLFSLVCLVYQLGGPAVTRRFDDVITAIAPLAAGWACIRAARRRLYGYGRAWTTALQRAWWLLGVAAVLWGIARMIGTWGELVRIRGGHFPSAFDVGFLLAPPLAAAGVLAFPTAPMRLLGQLRTLIDGLIIAGSLLFLSWAYVLRPIYRAGGDHPSAAVLAGLAYPAGDILTLAIAISVLARTKGRSLAQLGMITVGVLCLAVADSSFAYLSQTGSYQIGSLSDMGWLAGYLLLFLAALQPSTAELLRDEGDEVHSWAQLSVPYALLAVAATTAVVVQVTRGGLEAFLVYLGVALGVLAGCRQAVIVIENQQLYRRLKATVAELFEREAELEHELRKEHKAADNLRATDEMKDTFLRAVSHDLRNPLSAILGVAVTLERTKLSLPREQALDLIRMLVEKTRRLDRMLADLLDLNRLEQGILEPNRSLVDVTELIGRVLAEADYLSGWPVTVQAEPVWAAIDGPKVERILENLLVNTARHTSPGTSVWVRALTRENDLELIVEDAGPGVPKELAGSIFEPYRRGQGRGGLAPLREASANGGASRAAARPGPREGKGLGVGIGLSLVARFAQLHGGRAWVTDRDGGGASFHVLLPSCVRPAPKLAPAQPSAEHPAHVLGSTE